MSEPTLDPKLSELEKSLAALVPVPGRIDRDHLLFAAGQASVRQRHWFWPTVTAVLGIVACGLGTALALRPAPTTIERIVYVPVPQPTALPEAPRHEMVASASFSHAEPSAMNAEDKWAGSDGYLQQRNFAIRWGVEALPPPPPLDSVSQTPSVESMLGLPERDMEQGGFFRFKF
jgi:hypothetical protein